MPREISTERLSAERALDASNLALDFLACLLPDHREWYDVIVWFPACVDVVNLPEPVRAEAEQVIGLFSDANRSFDGMRAGLENLKRRLQLFLTDEQSRTAGEDDGG
jgi:hypothetical protein